MKVLMLCGYFAKENEQEVVAAARWPVEFSANLFQQKLIGGFRQQDCDFSVISAPFIGAFPNACSISRFKGFSAPQDVCTYVPFHNLWGYRNFSRARGLKKAVKDFISAEDPRKLILVYCPHTPFLEAAVYAKKQDPRIRICLYVPDLPEYMNLRSDRGWFYNLAKKADIRKMHGLMEQVDSFVLLTEPMTQALPIGDKPYIVREGILEDPIADRETSDGEDACRYIVYTGKMDEKFGIRELIRAFGGMQEPDWRLVLCGRGDCDDFAAEAAQKDPRILPMGQLTPAEAALWQKRAAVLVNPRGNDEAYTKYSFPSKNIEYLLTGKPVAAALLDGMPDCYRQFLHVIDPKAGQTQGIAAAIRSAMQETPQMQSARFAAFIQYASDTLSAKEIAGTIIEKFV